jgi:hypothetical protein
MIINIIKKIDRYIRPNNIKFGKFYFLFFLLFPRILKLRLFRDYIKIKKINYLKFLNSEKKKEEIRFVFNHNNIDGSLDTCSKILKDNGIVIIENAFQKDLIKKFIDKTSHLIFNNTNNNKQFASYNHFPIPIEDDPFLLSRVITETIIKSINFDNTNTLENLYVRELPRITYSIPNEENINSYWAKKWHVDFPTQFAAHVILKDIKKDGTRMRALPKSHFFPFLPGKHYNFDKIFSNSNLLEKNSVDCFGSSGTLYIHSGTLLHHGLPVKNKDRFLWGSTYTTDKVFHALDQIDLKSLFKDLSEDQINKIINDDRMILYKTYVENKDLPNTYFKINKKNQIKIAKKSDLTY